MKKLLAFLIVVVVVGGGAAAVYFYFRGTDKHLQLIPKDAAIVGSIDCKGLAAKIDFSKVQQLQLFKDLQEKAKNEKHDTESQKLMDVFNSPLSSGVNLLSDVYFFASTVDNKPLFAITVDIKDKNKFANTMGKIIPGSKITSGKNYQAVFNNQWSIGWNETGALFAFGGNNDTSTVMHHFFDAAFNRSRSESIMENKFFREYELTKKDMSLFLNMDGYMNLFKNLSPYSATLPFNTMAKKWEGTYFIMNTSFENNRIHTTWNLKSDNKNLDSLNYFHDKGITADESGSLTSKDVYALFSLSLNSDKLFSFFNDVPFWKETMENFATKSLGVGVKELESIFGGDLALTLNDFNDLGMEEPNPMMIQYYKSMNMPVPDYYLNPKPKFPRAVFSLFFSSNNKPLLKKLIDGKMMVRPDNIYFFPLSSDYTFYLAENKPGFTLTDDSSLAKNIATNHSLTPLKTDLADMVGNYPTASYFNLDLNHYPSPLLNYASKTVGEKIYNPVMDYFKILKDFRANGNFHGGEMNLNLTDGEGNSLYRLIAQGDEVYRMSKGSGI